MNDMDLWKDEEDALNASLSTEEFEKLCDEAFELKIEKERLESQKRDINEQLNRKQERIQAHLDQLGKTNHAGRMGTISMKVEAYPSVPKDPANRREFFEWLKRRGMFEDMITINANTLRGFYKAEKLASGDDPDFKIPGLEPFERISLTFRRKK